MTENQNANRVFAAMWILLIVLLGWIIVSLRNQRGKLLREVRGSYSKEEIVEMAIRIKREAALMFLAYGIVLGVVLFSLFRN